MKYLLSLIIITLSIASCKQKQKTSNKATTDPIEVLNNFTIDCFINQKPLELVLLEYTVLDQKDLSGDTDTLYEYCNFLNSEYSAKLLENNNGFEVIPYEESSAPFLLNLRPGEHGYFINTGGELLNICVLNPNNMIVSYFNDPFATKGNTKPLKPAYLKEILELKMEK